MAFDSASKACDNLSGVQPPVVNRPFAPKPSAAPPQAMRAQSSIAAPYVVQMKRRKYAGPQQFRHYEAVTSRDTPLLKNAFLNDAPDNILCTLPAGTKLKVNGWLFKHIQVTVVDPNRQTFLFKTGYIKTEDSAEDGAAYPAVGTPQYHREYESHLLQAVQILKKAKFGGSNEPRVYDSRYWRLDSDSDGDEIMVLKAGSPAEAIDELFANLQQRKWTFDCIEFVQVARWYALRHALGFEEFNRRTTITSFKLSYHETTLGVRGGYFFERDAKLEFFVGKNEVTHKTFKSSIRVTTPQEEDALLRNLPIGSRVMWADSNPEVADEDFENENVIKVGQDMFAGHPFGIRNAAGWRRKLALDEDERGLKIAKEEYARRYLFIKEFELYRRH
jgi:hypothetical protein